MLVVHAVLPIKPESRETFLQAVPQLIEASRAEEGVLEYGLHESIESPGTFVMVERYADQAALDAHFASEHFQAAAGALGQWLAGPPQITKYPAQDGETVPLG